MNVQRKLAVLAHGQRIAERRVARDVARVEQLIEDGHPVAAALRDAVRLPIAVLSLPPLAERFDALLSALDGDLA